MYRHQKDATVCSGRDLIVNLLSLSWKKRRDFKGLIAKHKRRRSWEEPLFGRTFKNSQSIKRLVAFVRSCLLWTASANLINTSCSSSVCFIFVRVSCTPCKLKEFFQQFPQFTNFTICSFVLIAFFIVFLSKCSVITSPMMLSVQLLGRIKSKLLLPLIVVLATLVSSGRAQQNTGQVEAVEYMNTVHNAASNHGGPVTGEYSADTSGSTHSSSGSHAAITANAYQATHPPMHATNYHGRQTGLTSASGGMINLLPVAFVAGFGLLLLIPLLFIFFSTGFGPSFGYGGYAGRKRSFDDFVSPFVHHLHPMLANVAKHPLVAELWKGVDAHSLFESLNLLPKSTPVAQPKSNATQYDATANLIKSIGHLLAPLFKDLLPVDWRKMLIQFVGKPATTSTGSSSPSSSASIDKGPHYKTN